MKTFRIKTPWLLAVVPLLFLLAFYTAQAERNGGQGDGSQEGENMQSQGSDEADQLQDRDRLQDSTLHDDDYEPQQDRDRLQTQDLTTVTADQDQEQSQGRDQLKDGTGDGEPDQDQDRDRIHVDSAESLDQYVMEQNQVRSQEQEGEGAQVQTRVEARVAADAIMAAESLLGQGGAHMSQVAQEMSQAMDSLTKNESLLENRSRLQLFLFGQDSEAVSEMEQTMEQNQSRIEEMQQYILTCEDCDQAAVQLVQNQIQNLEQEQNRLQTVVSDAGDQLGLFGFLFGWLR